MLKPLAAGPRQLREFFTKAGFEQEQFQNNPALRKLPSQRAGNLPRLMEQFSDPTPQNLLLRWFFLGHPQDSVAVEPLIPASIVAELIETGMLRQEGGVLVPTVMVTPCEGFLFTADPIHRLESPDSAGTVLWPSPSTQILEMLMIRRPCGTTLDLGAGCGILAILASMHSAHVVATDLNPRAAEFIAFNAWLNGASNLECLTGDTFEPVEGRTFDMIVSNPPFFVTPGYGQLYCETGMELDGYCRRLVKSVQRYLNEGGFLQITFEWVKVSGEAWQDRLADWLKDSGCDGWVAHSYARTADAYAAERLERMTGYSPETVSQRLPEWQSYYRSRGVEEIHGGVLVMRRRSGSNWIRIEEMPGLESAEPFGDQVLELFHNQDRLETDRTEESMLDWRPRVSPHVRLEQQSQLVEGKWRPVSAQLRRIGALAGSLGTDRQVTEFLSSCDGTRTISELAAELAQTIKVDRQQVSSQCCAIVRKLVERRLVLL